MRRLLEQGARVVAVVGLSLALGACAAGTYYYSARESDLIKSDYAATDVLVSGGKVAENGGPVLVATVVDIDNLERSRADPGC
jgi:hypothetical protein